MAATTTQIQIANRALQLVGYQRINSITDNNRGAIAINRAYQPCLLKTLRENFWGFAIKRATLAASATLPSFGPAFYYPLPPDYLMLAPPDQFSQQNYQYVPSLQASPVGRIPVDWQIENMGGGLAIASNDQGPIYIRYVSSAVTEALFDVSFAEALAANLAYDVCEELTQSQSKFQIISKVYDDAIEMARKRNAFEMQPIEAPVDSYVSMRY